MTTIGRTAELQAPANGVRAELVKVAWIRDPGQPVGQLGTGRLNCRCGDAPHSAYHRGAPDVLCRCGQRYTFDGWLVA